MEQDDEMTMEQLAIEQEKILKAQQHRAMLAKKVTERAAQDNPEEHERQLAKLRIIKTKAIDAMEPDTLYDQLLSRGDIRDFYDNTKAEDFVIPNFQRASFEAGTSSQYRDYLLQKWGKDSIKDVTADIHLAKLTDITDRCQWAMEDKHKGQVALDIAEARQSNPVEAHYLQSKVNLEKSLFNFKNGEFDQDLYQHLIDDYKTLRKFELTHNLKNDVDTPQAFVYSTKHVLETHEQDLKDTAKAEKAMRNQGFNEDYALAYRYENTQKGQVVHVDLIDKSNDAVIGMYSQPGTVPNENCKKWLQKAISEHADINIDQVELQPVKGMLGIRLLSEEQLEAKNSNKVQAAAKPVDPLKAAQDAHLMEEFKDQTANLSYKESDRNVIAFENSKLLYEVHQNEDAAFFKKLQKSGIPILPKSMYDTAVEAQKNSLLLEGKTMPELVHQEVAEAPQQVAQNSNTLSLSSKIQQMRKR